MVRKRKEQTTRSGERHNDVARFYALEELYSQAVDLYLVLLMRLSPVENRGEKWKEDLENTILIGAFGVLDSITTRREKLHFIVTVMKVATEVNHQFSKQAFAKIKKFNLYEFCNFR